MEDGVSGVVGFSLVAGLGIRFIMSLRFLGKKMLRAMEGKMRWVEKHVRSFFLCMFYTAYLVPLFNMCGLGLAKVALEDVDIG